MWFCIEKLLGYNTVNCMWPKRATIFWIVFGCLVWKCWWSRIVCDCSHILWCFSVFLVLSLFVSMSVSSSPIFFPEEIVSMWRLMAQFQHDGVSSACFGLLFLLLALCPSILGLLISRHLIIWLVCLVYFFISCMLSLLTKTRSALLMDTCLLLLVVIIFLLHFPCLYHLCFMFPILS